MTRHRLLERQLARAVQSDGTLDLPAFVELVSEAYAEADRDRRRTDRSMGLMIEELGQANESLRRTVADRTAELDVIGQRLLATLETLDQGIMMIDAHGHVVVHNRRLVDLTGVPEHIFAARPLFRDVVARQAEQGEFGQEVGPFRDWLVSEGWKAGATSFRRTRPNGTVIEVRCFPLPDGGEVRTLSDVTDAVRHTEEIQAIRRMLESTIENVTQGIMMIDAGRRIVVHNRRLSELLELPEGYLAEGRSFDELLEFQFNRGEFSGSEEQFRAFVRSGGIAEGEQFYERVRPNGTVLEVRTIPLPDGGAVRTFADITERRMTESAIARAEAEYRGLFENSVVGIYRTNMEGKQLRANPALVRLNGYETEAEMLAAVNDIASEWYVDPNRRDEFLAVMARDGRTTDFVSEVYRHKSREKIWVSESAWVVRDAEGNPICFEGMVIDATQRVEAEAAIAHLARHDQLTNLPNRILFHDRLAAILTSRRRRPDAAILCVDLDHFKEINDTMGHDVGDILLRLAARRLRRAAPPGATPSRFGGDEFAVLLPGLTERSALEALAARLVARLSAPFRIRGQRVFVGASIGIAIAPTDGQDATELLKKADIALYRAKAAGRGTFAFFDAEMMAAVNARRTVEADLRRAILADEFVVHYQPIVDITTGSPCSYEALVRWNHPRQGLLHPAAFIDIAEDSGLISGIGEAVLRKACREIAALGPEARISVNLSPVQLRNHQILVAVVQSLRDSGLLPRQLDLEITETVLLADNPATHNILSQLRTLGVRIVLDDFGIGHSSLSYLQKFKFDRIKIDRSFLQASGQMETNTAILRAILGLGRDLGIEIVVEGVETEGQLALLRDERCRYAQGYLFGRPAALADLSVSCYPALRQREAAA